MYPQYSFVSGLYLGPANLKLRPPVLVKTEEKIYQLITFTKGIAMKGV